MGGIQPAEKSEYGGRPPGKIDASLNEKLSAVEWGEYRIETLFTSSNGDFDLQKKHINGLGDYVITSGLTDKGILGKTDAPAKIFEKGTITVDMFGCPFYRQFQYKMVTHARVFSLKPVFALTHNQGLFLSNSLKFLSREFGYENMCSWEKIKTKTIQLPQYNGKIDFDFMENFIAELEAQRIAELEAYLSVTGLKDTHLSAEEEQALACYSEVEFKQFDIIEVFDVKNTGNILSRDIVENSGRIPYLCASAENNAVSSYIKYDESLINEGNCVFIGGKTFVVSYQEKNFYSNDSHNLALYPRQCERNKLNQLYLATCVYKSLNHKYSWGNSISNAKIKKDKISLPVKDAKPDYSIMPTLISAIQKLVIKDVVAYSDKKLDATKQTISK